MGIIIFIKKFFLIRKGKYIGLLLFVGILFFSCRREIWDTDIECLLTNWTNKHWVSTDAAISGRTYYWSQPRSFIDNDGTKGLWYLPMSGEIRETSFTDSGIIVLEYKIILIDKNNFSKRLLNNPAAPVIVYHAR